LSAMPAAAAPPDAAAPPGDAASLDERYFHRSWRRGDGLPGNSVYAIAQTADGYLWIGTENGLARFDGRRFTPYRERPEGPPGSRFVAAPAAARDGTLWIGTERGLLRLRGAGGGGGAGTGTGTGTGAGALVRDGAPGGPAAAAAVTALAEDAGGDLWIGT